MRSMRSWLLGTLVFFNSSLVCAYAQASSAHLQPQVTPYFVESGAAFSADGKLVVMGDANKTVGLWNLSDFTLVRTFSGSEQLVNCVTISPDDKLVAAGGVDGKVHVWEATTGRLIRTLDTAAGAPSSVAFTESDNQLTVVKSDVVQNWRVRDWTLVTSTRSEPSVQNKLSITPDGRYVLDTSGKLATIFDRKTKTFASKLAGDIKAMDVRLFADDGHIVVFTDAKAKTFIWNSGSDNLVAVPLPVGENQICAALAPDDSAMVTVSSTDLLQVWDTHNGHLAKRYRLPKSSSDPEDRSQVCHLLYAPDHRHLFYASDEEDPPAIWDLDTGKYTSFTGGQLARQGVPIITGDGRYLSVHTSAPALQAWDFKTGALTSLLAFNFHAQTYELSPDGTLALVFKKAVVSVCEIHTGHCKDISGVKGDLAGAAISPTNQHYAIALMSGELTLYNLSSGQVEGTYTGLSTPPNDLTFSRDGSSLITADLLNGVVVWPLNRSKKPYQLSRDSASKLYLSRDGRRLLGSGATKNLSVWDLKSGKSVRAFHSEDLLANDMAAMSPDGRRLAQPGANGIIRVFDVDTGTALLDMHGEAGQTAGVSFSQDAKFLFVNDFAGATNVWNLTNGQQVATMTVSQTGGWMVTAPSGRFDASDLESNKMVAWVLETNPMQALPAEVFMRDYYTPGLLVKILNGGYLGPHVSIASIRNRVQPIVSIVAVKPSESAPSHVDVVVRASSYLDPQTNQSSGLADLRLFRDGQMVANGYRPGALKDGNYVFRDVMLKGRANKVDFTAYALNSEHIKSQTASLEYRVERPAVVALVKPKAYLLQLGINHYKAKGCELRYAASDADAMNAALTKRLVAHGFQVEASKLESVAGGDFMSAGKKSIHDALATVAQKATPDDAIFISFSGHGYSNGEAFYLMPSDIDGNCEGVDDSLLKSAISADELADWLRPIDAGEMTLILDACDSANSVQGGGFKPGPMGSRGLGQLAYDKRMRVLAASESSESAYEPTSLSAGRLTYVLVEAGLKQGRADWKPVDHKITVGEWLSYGVDAVPRLQDAGDKQTPVLFDFTKSDTLSLQ